MERWRGLDAIPGDWGRCVVTIGVFDGVHAGHRHLIGRAVAAAHDLGVPSVVCTFDPHPAEVVRPGSHPPVLSPPRLKARLIEAAGADVMLVLPFTLDFSRMAPEEFVHHVLVERLHAACVLVGENFRFGHRGAGTVERLAELGRTFGFTVDAVPLLAADGTPISSTYIRSLVLAGEVRAATAVLGRPPRIEGIVVRGEQRGRQLGYPTANIEGTPHAAVPADGIYAGWLWHRGRRLPVAISVGTNPTFEGKHRTVEAYVLDEEIDLYGEHISVDFIERLRSMERFPDAASLVAAIDGDVRRTRQVLAAEPPVQ